MDPNKKILFKHKHYIIYEEILGLGAFGSVHLGYDTKKKQEVAVKRVFNASISFSKTEIDALQCLKDHDNIVRMLDYFQKDGMNCIITQLLRGHTLDKYLSIHNPDISIKIELCEQLLEAIQHMHYNDPPLSHRDLKPVNIIIVRGHQLKLLDFGLACPVEGKTYATVIGGTRAYMAPELFVVSKYNPFQGDIFAAGLIILAVATFQKDKKIDNLFAPEFDVGIGQQMLQTSNRDVLAKRIDGLHYPCSQTMGLIRLAKSMVNFQPEKRPDTNTVYQTIMSIRKQAPTADSQGGTLSRVEARPEDPVAPRDPAPKDPAPRDPATKDPAPRDPAPRDPAPRDPVPRDPAPRDPAPRDPAPRDPAPRDPAPRDPAPRDPAPRDPAPKDPTLKDPAPRGLTPRDPAPRDPAPRDPAPRDPAPRDPAPRDPAPRDHVKPISKSGPTTHSQGGTSPKAETSREDPVAPAPRDPIVVRPKIKEPVEPKAPRDNNKISKTESSPAGEVPTSLTSIVHHKLEHKAFFHVGFSYANDVLLEDKNEPNLLRLFHFDGKKYSQTWEKAMPAGMYRNCRKAMSTDGEILLQESHNSPTVRYNRHLQQQQEYQGEGYLLGCSENRDIIHKVKIGNTDDWKIEVWNPRGTLVRTLQPPAGQRGWGADLSMCTTRSRMVVTDWMTDSLDIFTLTGEHVLHKPLPYAPAFHNAVTRCGSGDYVIIAARHKPDVHVHNVLTGEKAATFSYQQLGLSQDQCVHGVRCCDGVLHIATGELYKGTEYLHAYKLQFRMREDQDEREQDARALEAQSQPTQARPTQARPTQSRQTQLKATQSQSTPSKTCQIM